MKNVRLACLAVSLVLGATAGASAPGSGPVCEASPASQSIEKVGEEVVRRLESPHPYAAVEPRAATGALHTETLTHPGASYIVPHFATLELEEGDSIIVRAPDGSRSWRYDNTPPGARDGFWGIPIPGDTALIELHGPAVHRQGVLDAYGYRIDKYARGYTAQELGTNGVQAEALCGADASGNGDTYLRLYTSTGTLVGASDNACGSLSYLSYTVPAGAGGTYQLRAGCASNRSCGGTVAYTLQ